MVVSDGLSNTEIGRRLSIARKFSGKGLEESASVIGLSPHSLTQIEKGAKSLGLREIESLANYYDSNSGRILCLDAVHTDLFPSYRKMFKTDDKHSFEAKRLMNFLFSAEVELENILGIEHKFNYPQKRSVPYAGDVKKLALKHAKELRNYLDLGNNPISNIFSLIEKDLGIRLFQCKLNRESTVLGLYAYDKDLGACILLNANEKRPRRVMSAAHELGHFIGNRDQYEVLEENEQVKSRDEIFAISFSYAFTMPEESFRYAFNEISGGSNCLTKETVILLANEFNVSNISCVRRIEALELDENALDWYKAVNGINREDMEYILGPEKLKKRYFEEDEFDRLIPKGLSKMAHKSWKQKILSEGQLSSLLNLGLIDLRDILFEIENGDKGID